MKFGRKVVKRKQHKNYQDENKKSAMNKELILRVFLGFYLDDVQDLVSKRFKSGVIKGPILVVGDRRIKKNPWGAILEELYKKSEKLVI